MAIVDPEDQYAYSEVFLTALDQVIAVALASVDVLMLSVVVR
jgi:hypothetical protein